MTKKYLDIDPIVEEKLQNREPVVALESTIISHGMPYPKNLETAKKVERIVRENGAIPATICILDGRLKVGLNGNELECLAKNKEVLKASRRDLPYLISKKMNGATTVAATMIIANLAGIRVFVTGGIGGVHLGAEKSLDVSADLQELAKTDVAVVCAGAKSILDIGLTLEYLETVGVPVIGYQTENFPAFYSRGSGFSVDYKLNSSIEVADLMKTKWDLGLDGGLVIGNPIPKKHEMKLEVIDKAIESALAEAGQKNIKGKEITPFLLAKIAEVTGEKSLEANIQLVFNNAKVGAQIAVEYNNFIN